MITIARFHPEAQQLECVAAIISNEIMDVSEFPPLALEPPGVGTQSEAIHTRKPVIIPDLAARLKKVSKAVEVDSEGHEGGSSPQSAICVPMLARGEVIGVVQLQSSLRSRYTEEDADILTVVANTAAVAVQNAGLIEHLNESKAVIEAGYDSTLQGLSRALEIRDQETEGHTNRVADLSLNFGARLRLNDQSQVDLWRGALMHDIGKIGVPDSILKKAGPLTKDEWLIMRKHAEDGYRILMDVPFLQNSLDVLRYHHEKWDGSGYPFGLKGEDIPLHARMFALIDVWDALVTDRPYRKAWSKQQAMEFIRNGASSHFDPYLVNEFVELISGLGLLDG
jgi:HD-GYP domain-containing protein (c-di-GMP phosphodiesterase class II)